MSLVHWDMDSTKEQQDWINSLKEILKGQDNRVECRTLGQTGGKGFN